MRTLSFFGLDWAVVLHWRSRKRCLASLMMAMAHCKQPVSHHLWQASRITLRYASRNRRKGQFRLCGQAALGPAAGLLG